MAKSASARVIFARHGERDIGFIFGSVAGAYYRGQQFSYDDAWGAYSIGNILQLEQVRQLCEEGGERYDMGPLLGSRMGYKRHWAEIRLPLETWTLSRKDPGKRTGGRKHAG